MYLGLFILFLFYFVPLITLTTSVLIHKFMNRYSILDVFEYLILASLPLVNFFVLVAICLDEMERNK